MTRSSKFASAAIAVGLALLGIANVQQQLTEAFPSIPAAAYPICAAIGIAVLAVGLLVWLWLRLPRPLVSVYELQRARPDQLEELRAFAGDLIEAHLMTVPRLQAWQQRQPDCHHLVFKVSRGPFRQSRELVGFFSVVAVTAEARDALSQTQPNGFRVEPHHLARTAEEAAALYVAAIGAKGFRARGQTIGALSGFLAAHVNAVPLVFTRPVTQDGLRLARQHQFTPVTLTGEPEERIYARRYDS